MSNSWRSHPKLQGRFHPQAPDDVQVVVHDGGPRMTEHKPEIVWVRVTDVANDVFTGEVLNQPHHLTSVSQGAHIRFLVPVSGEYPLQVSEKYLAERSDWSIVPCERCGLSELFDAPSDLIRKIFPNAPSDGAMGMFTSFCGFCGGVQIVRNKALGESSKGEEPAEKKKWWRFW
ncbi:MAG: hypothetical protein QM758_04810 [Armatimonas sp.]